MARPPDFVWYVAYGSNLARRRLQEYLDRGRDPTVPRADRPLTMGHELFFAGESTVWTGGRAYVDHAPKPGVRTLARAWALSRQQWTDLLACESGRAADDDCDSWSMARGECRAVGTGRYDTVVGLGEKAGLPMLTFTGSDPIDPLTCTSPSARYLAAVATGLAEAHGLGPVEAARYLLARPGVAGAWAPPDLLTVVGGTKVA